jgi:hypothetical protein
MLTVRHASTPYEIRVNEKETTKTPKHKEKRNSQKLLISGACFLPVGFVSWCLGGGFMKV